MPDNEALKKTLDAVRAQLDAIEKTLGFEGEAAPVTPAPAAAPEPAAATPDDVAKLSARENDLTARITAMVQQMIQQSNAIQAQIAQYQANWMPVPPQLLMQQAQLYQSAVAQFETMGPEARELAKLGRGNPIGLIDANKADCSKAAATVGAMLGSMQGFAAQNAQIVADANKATTQTILDMNKTASDAFARTNAAWEGYIKS